MTAEVAVMNAQAVALAADSAVTLDPTQKTFSSADKIFGLSSWEPVAAMVYGNAAFMGVPWETVLKSYRRYLGKRSCATVRDYVDDFTSFLRGNTALFPPDARDRQVRSEIRSRLLLIRERAEEVLAVALSQRPAVDRAWVERAVAEQVNVFYQIWQDASPIPGLTTADANRLLSKHAESSRLIQKHVFQDLPLSRACKLQLDQLRVWFLTRFQTHPECLASHESGVVFAGFGRAENFPAVAEVALDGIVDDVLRYRIGRVRSVTRANPAVVIPFGQSDMVATFMEGIDPLIRINLEKELGELWKGYPDVVLNAMPDLDEATRANVRQRISEITLAAFERQLAALKKWRERNYARRTLFVIQSLPKDELATVAESLISLTSLKRRVSMDYTVGGPIDVCLISKHDGCVWVKKKHYFSAELNPHFFLRYRNLPKETQSDAEADTYVEAETGSEATQDDAITPVAEELISFSHGDPGPLLPESNSPRSGRRTAPATGRAVARR